MNNEFESDIDIYTYNDVVKDACELADIFGLNYRVLQSSKEKTNICVTFDPNNLDNTQEFMVSIEQLNKLKENELNSRF